MKATTRFTLGFTLSIVMMCFIWWLGGYNFDSRSPDVAFAAFMTLMVSVFVGGIFAGGV